jgi:acyl carrier protein
MAQRRHKPAAFGWHACATFPLTMIEREEIYGRSRSSPSTRRVSMTDATTFAGDLEWDSLTVMDFVAAIEDEFDITDHDEHAGRDRDGRPAGRFRRQAEGRIDDRRDRHARDGATVPIAPAGIARPAAKFQPLIKRARGAARDRRARSVRDRDDRGEVADPRGDPGQGYDPARHLQLYGHDLRSRRDRGGQEGARRFRLGHHRQPRAQRHLRSASRLSRMR